MQLSHSNMNPIALLLTSHYQPAVAECLVAAAALLLLCWWSRACTSPPRGAGGRIVPSAPRVPLLGSTPWVLAHRNDFFPYLQEQFERHGQLTTFTAKWIASPRFFFTANPAIVEHVLKTNFENYVKGPIVRRNLSQLLGAGIFVVDGPAWREQRRLASHMFSFAEFRDTIFESLRLHADELDAHLQRLAEAAAPCDMQALFLSFTLDTIGDIAFGDRIGALHSPGVPFARAFDGAQAMVQKRFVTPGWALWERLDGSHASLHADLAVISDYCSKLIRARRVSGAFLTGSDLLSRVMRMEDEEGQLIHLHDDDFLRDVIVSRRRARTMPCRCNAEYAVWWRCMLWGLSLWGLRLWGLRLWGLRLWGLSLWGLRLWGLRLWGLSLHSA